MFRVQSVQRDAEVFRVLGHDDGVGKHVSLTRDDLERVGGGSYDQVVAVFILLGLAVDDQSRPVAPEEEYAKYTALVVARKAELADLEAKIAEKSAVLDSVVVVKP